MSRDRYDEARIQDMTTVAFEEVEAELMRDPEVRAAAEELEPAYQRERRRIKARLERTWRTCPVCKGACSVPVQTTFAPMGKEFDGERCICRTCEGLGKVPKEGK